MLNKGKPSAPEQVFQRPKVHAEEIGSVLLAETFGCQGRNRRTGLSFKRGGNSRQNFNDAIASSVHVYLLIRLKYSVDSGQASAALASTQS